MPKFEPGQSGNPAGRTLGSSDKRSEKRKLLEARGPEILEKAIELALGGEVKLIIALLDRWLPTLRAEAERAPIAITPQLDPASQAREIFKRVADGELSVDEGATMMGGVRTWNDADRTGALADQVAILSAKAGVEMSPDMVTRAAIMQAKRQ
jgi:hypothetical protein